MSWLELDREVEGVGDAVGAVVFTLAVSSIVLLPLGLVVADAVPGYVTEVENAVGVLIAGLVGVVSLGFALTAWEARRALVRGRLARLAMETTDFAFFEDLKHFVILDRDVGQVELHVPLELPGVDFRVVGGGGEGFRDPVLATCVRVTEGDPRTAEGWLEGLRELVIEAAVGPGAFQVSRYACRVLFPLERPWTADELVAVRGQAVAAHELAQALSLKADSSSASGSPKRR